MSTESLLEEWSRLVLSASFMNCRLLLSCLIGLVLAWAGAGGADGAPRPERERPKAGSWIWDHGDPSARQECRFVRAFDIPAGAEVVSAELQVTADNSYQVFLDGQFIGRGGDWQAVISYDLKLLLSPGRHVLAVEALNDFDKAGLLLGLRVKLADGRSISVDSDASWKIAPNGVAGWQKKSRDWDAWRNAKVLYPMDKDYLPLIYDEPITQPVEVAFWQHPAFQIGVSAVALAGIVTGLFLGSRLFLKSQMERVIRRERARIAVDLHDDLGGGLTQLVLLGETSRREVAEDAPAADALGRLCDQSRGLLRGMNETVWLINSERDTIRDFASYVVKYAESFFQNSPVRCRFDIEDDLPPLPCDLGIRRNLFLAVKEAMNNILRHSGATSVEVEIRRQRNDLVVAIRDNGHGFENAAGGEGNGLRNMARRAREAGGRFSVESAQGKGTAVEFRVPFHAPLHVRLARVLSWNRRDRPVDSPAR
ncbi:MAG: hypothetical protein EOP88_22525 [Verrucomicrobiaceae bacterium]|nr:MAG: hypothetical protein EOP88_22525 [Verrucomicrobiaceae bacterium]